MNPVNTTLSLFHNTQNNSNHSKPSSGNKIKIKRRRAKLNSGLFVSNNAHAKSAKSKLIPGQLVELLPDSDLFKMLTRANLEPFLSYPSKRVLPNMVSEFYANLTLNPGLNGTVFLTSIVSGIPCLIDQEILISALKLHASLTTPTHVDISKSFLFDMNEYRNFISTFCNVEVPHNVFSNDRGFNSAHFIPLYQNLATFVKENVFPSLEKSVSFLDMKIMYKIATNRISFNIPHMLMTKMHAASKAGYSPYGLLPTKVFEHMKYNICIPHFFHVTNTISELCTKSVLPLNIHRDPPMVSNMVVEPPRQIDLSLSLSLSTMRNLGQCLLIWTCLRLSVLK